jgi:CheY-like chemotaxis protein
MPVLDGWDTARIMRQEHGLSLPILACTASDLSAPAGGSNVHQHALNCGADMCLSKPLTAAQLTAALQQLHVLPAADGTELGSPVPCGATAAAAGPLCNALDA